MLKALSFLGLPASKKPGEEGRYERVIYQLDEQRCETELFPEAVVSFFKPEQLIIFVTPEVKKHSHFKELKDRTEQMPNLQLTVVDISKGSTEKELWDFFDKITAVVEQDDEIILDVTHAFRSIPLLAFIAIAYLRVAKNIKLKRVIYGNLMAKDKVTNVAPVFDLTPFEKLLEWLAAVDALKRRDDASKLSELLIEAHSLPWKQKETETPELISKTATALDTLCKSLHLARPMDISNCAQSLMQYLPNVRDEVERWAKPFTMLLDEVAEQYRPFIMERPKELDRNHLEVQLQMIVRFVDKKLITQAVTLAREWVVSLLALHLETPWLEKDNRAEIEHALNVAAASIREDSNTRPPIWWHKLPRSREMAEVWNFIIDLRNDVAHCGMRSAPAAVKSIEQRTHKLPRLLLNLLHETPHNKVSGVSAIIIDLKEIYGEVAKLSKLSDYLEKIMQAAGEGNEVILTGQAPVWLYLKAAHELHGKARRLHYNSPSADTITVFDHDAR